MIKVGMIGYGLSGRYLQAPFFAQNPSFSLEAVVTNSTNPKEQYPKVRVLNSVDDLISDKNIDLISICSPSDTHFEYAKKTLLAGKHCLVEKPFTATLGEAEELFDLAKKMGKVITTFQNRRFDSDFLTVKKIIKTGLLGNLVSYEAHFDRYKPVLNPKKWKETVQPANGILYDLGSHILDQAIVLFGNPISVSGEKFTQREGSDIDDAFDMRLNYGKLKVKLAASLLVKKQGPRYIIHGTNGTFTKYGIDVQEDHSKEGLLPSDSSFGIEPEKEYGLLTYEKDGQDHSVRIATEKGNWAGFFQNLADAINGKTEIEVKAGQILEQIQILEKIEHIDLSL
jgi:scyllo-inositol 2-dehydrogenase (NADP+)